MKKNTRSPVDLPIASKNQTDANLSSKAKYKEAKIEKGIAPRSLAKVGEDEMSKI